jgi:hypothetical protein
MKTRCGSARGGGDGAPSGAAWRHSLLRDLEAARATEDLAIDPISLMPLELLICAVRLWTHGQIAYRIVLRL